MKEHKKNARPTAATVKRAKGSGAFRASSDPVSQSTTPAPPGQALKIADFLHPGQQNAVPLKQLKELLHQDGRTVRRMIQAERLHGVPILADNQTGYYLPGSTDERARCVKSMRHRAREISRAADAIEGAAGLD